MKCWLWIFCWGGKKDVALPDAIICIADASNLERNLYLFSQVLDLSIPVVLVLNMCDLARSRGIEIDSEALSTKLKLPVVCTEAHHGKGINELKAAILKIGVGAEHQPLVLFRKYFIKNEICSRKNYRTNRSRGRLTFWSIDYCLMLAGMSNLTLNIRHTTAWSMIYSRHARG